ncbi:MAG: hypothetical protein Q4G40_08200, partial [Brachybacterium sp.]|nr:hypothetical protein [Brachybacterium sp.]
SIRNLDDHVHATLRRRARGAGRSMEEEIRRILTEATIEAPAVSPFERLARRTHDAGGADLEMPPPQFVSGIDRDTAFS